MATEKQGDWWEDLIPSDSNERITPDGSITQNKLVKQGTVKNRLFLVNSQAEEERQRRTAVREQHKQNKENLSSPAGRSRGQSARLTAQTELFSPRSEGNPSPRANAIVKFDPVAQTSPNKFPAEPKVPVTKLKLKNQVGGDQINNPRSQKKAANQRHRNNPRAENNQNVRRSRTGSVLAAFRSVSQRSRKKDFDRMKTTDSGPASPQAMLAQNSEDDQQVSQLEGDKFELANVPEGILSPNVSETTSGRSNRQPWQRAKKQNPGTAPKPKVSKPNWTAKKRRHKPNHTSVNTPSQLRNKRGGKTGKLAKVAENRDRASTMRKGSNGSLFLGDGGVVIHAEESFGSIGSSLAPIRQPTFSESAE